MENTPEAFITFLLVTILLCAPLFYTSILSPVSAHPSTDVNAAPIFTDSSWTDFQAGLQPILYTFVKSGHSTFNLDVYVKDIGDNFTLNTPKVGDIAPTVSDVHSRTGSGDSRIERLYRQFQWDLSTLTDASINLPQAYGLRLNATDIHGASTIVDASLVVYRDQIPDPIVSLDKTSYGQGDTVVVTILDPSKNTNADLSPSSLEHITVNIPNQDITQLTEVDINDDPGVDAGTFRGKFTVACNASGSSCAKLEVKYGGKKFDFDVAKQRLWLDSSKYSIGDTAEIHLTDPNTSSSSLSVQALVSSPTTPGGIGIDLYRSSAGNEFTGTVNLVASSLLSSPGSLIVEDGEDITVQYPAESPVREEKGRIFSSTEVQFNKDSYDYTDLARITVKDPKADTNSSKIDVVSVTITTDASALDSVTLYLAEDAPDSGVFHEITVLQFNSDGSDDLAKRIMVLDDPAITTMITATYISSEGAKVDTATLEPPAPGELTALGVGETGATPVAAQTIASIPILSCSGSVNGPDNDKDGLCDYWEYPRKAKLTIPYTSGGTTTWYQFAYFANPIPNSSNKDLLVEIDYLSGSGPTTTLLTDIKNTFTNKNIKFQYDRDESFTLPAGNTLYVWSDQDGTDDYDLSPVGGTLNSYTEVKRTYFGTDNSERLVIGGDLGAAINGKGAALFQAVHYVVWGNSMIQHFDTGSSGIAEFLGNDGIVSLGSFALSDYKQKGTFMHEFGHNLGLHHGGGYLTLNTGGTITWMSDYQTNCKPNYVSPESYVRQWPTAVPSVNLVNGWAASYSSETLTPGNMDYNGNLNESNGPNSATSSIDIVWGVGPPGSRVAKQDTVYVSGQGDRNFDWNGDNIISTSNNQVTDIGIAGCGAANVAPDGVINGFNDWTHLILNASQYSSSNWAAPGFSSSSPSGIPGMSIGHASGHFDMNVTQWQGFLKLGVTSLNYQINQLNDTLFANGTLSKNALSDGLVGKGGSSVNNGNINDVSFSGYSGNLDHGFVRIIAAGGNNVMSNDTGASSGSVTNGPAHFKALFANHSQITVQPRKDGMTLNFTILGGDLQDGTYDIEVNCTIPKVNLVFDDALVVNNGKGSKDLTIPLESGAYVGCKTKVGNNESESPPRFDVPQGNQSASKKLSVLTYIEKNQMSEAVNRLLELRRYVDGFVGGDLADDIIIDSNAKIAVQQGIDANIYTLAMELSGKNFTLTSIYNGQFYSIVADSNTVRMGDSSTFSIDPGVAIKDMKFQGSGPFTLKLPYNVAQNWNTKFSPANTILLVDGVAVDNNTSVWTIRKSTDPFYAVYISFNVPHNAASGDLHTGEIRSTNVVPEFVTISTLTLAITIAAVITLLSVAARRRAFL